jgi:hypothetical protein
MMDMTSELSLQSIIFALILFFSGGDVEKIELMLYNEGSYQRAEMVPEGRFWSASGAGLPDLKIALRGNELLVETGEKSGEVVDLSDILAAAKAHDWSTDSVFFPYGDIAIRRTEDGLHIFPFGLEQTAERAEVTYVRSGKKPPAPTIDVTLDGISVGSDAYTIETLGQWLDKQPKGTTIELRSAREVTFGTVKEILELISDRSLRVVFKTLAE